MLTSSCGWNVMHAYHTFFSAIKACPRCYSCWHKPRETLIFDLCLLHTYIDFDHLLPSNCHLLPVAWVLWVPEALRLTLSLYEAELPPRGCNMSDGGANFAAVLGAPSLLSTKDFASCSEPTDSVDVCSLESCCPLLLRCIPPWSPL